MSQETLGYVKLEWTCPKCNSRNPGPEKTCLSCGAPQPENVQFEQVQQQEISQDAALKKIAESGADVHCPFCGTRNSAGSKECSQCGADLEKGVRRESGKVIGAFQAGPARQIACPSCGAMNPENTLKCTQCGAPLTRWPSPQAAAPVGQISPRAGILPIMLGGAFMLICILALVFFLFLSSPRDSQTGTVQNVGWQTSLTIEALGSVTRQAWQDQIPPNADVSSCVERVREVVNQEPIGEKYNKVCGTPYTVDTGTGVGKVVQDCEFELLRPYCEYTVQEWRVVDQVQLNGSDLNPVFPSPRLESGQRPGNQSAQFLVIFETSEGKYTYRPNSLIEFQQYRPGSEWILNINAFGEVISVEAP